MFLVSQCLVTNLLRLNQLRAALRTTAVIMSSLYIITSSLVTHYTPSLIIRNYSSCASCRACAELGGVPNTTASYTGCVIYALSLVCCETWDRDVIGRLTRTYYPAVIFQPLCVLDLAAMTSASRGFTRESGDYPVTVNEIIHSPRCTYQVRGRECVCGVRCEVCTV